jgi:hypothetical protein
MPNSKAAKMIDDLVNHTSGHPGDTFDRHTLPRNKSRSPVQLEDDKPGRHSKGSGSNSARLSRRSSKASGKEPKPKRSSPESEDPSFHRREQLDHDVYDSHKGTGAKHEDVSDSHESSGPKRDEDVLDSQKSAGHKAIHASRKSLFDTHGLRGISAKNVHHVAFSPETCATQPAAAP